MRCLVLAGLMMYVSAGLCACGQKGPLVLPDAPKRKHTLPTLPAPAAPKTPADTPAPAERFPANGPPQP